MPHLGSIVSECNDSDVGTLCAVVTTINCTKYAPSPEVKGAAPAFIGQHTEQHKGSVTVTYSPKRRKLQVTLHQCLDYYVRDYSYTTNGTRMDV